MNWKNDCDPEEEKEEAAQERDRSADRQDGAVTLKSEQGLIHCITIIGQIEGHTALPSQTKATRYEHMLPQLAAVEESPEIRGLLLLINTVGGDVEAGLAIAELIAGMKTPVASLVLGGGHSIGIPLAVAARRSFIVPSATMTVHPVRFSGLVVGVPQTFETFLRIQERIIRFITENSRIPDSRLREFMLNTRELTTDVGTVLDGEHAVAEGLIDQVGSLSHALEWLHRNM